MIAKKPGNERQRVKILWQYDVLDTVPEEVFDDLTDLAAHICEAPVALISLVDEDRQWFKSRVGISSSEPSRDISFCAHAILNNGLFIVSDASKDPRFKNNPLVTGPKKIRFYAGAPLVTPDGYALGTLCVLDSKARTLRPEQANALRVLAHHVVSQLELRRHAKELAAIRKDSNKQRASLERALAETIGDDIAWSAAQNPLPGECEGYLNCYVYVLTETEGRYLRYYPNGKKSKEAISLIERSLDMIVNNTSNYEGPTDATDRAELKKMLAELAAILAGSKHQEKTGALLKIKLIGELI